MKKLLVVTCGERSSD